MAFNLEEGKATILDCLDMAMTAANDAVQELFQKSFVGVLEEYPWQFLQKFLVDYCEHVDQHLANDIISQLEEFFAGPGSFSDFARQIDNSDAAVEAVTEIEQKIISEIPDYLSGYEPYISPIREKLTSLADARFNEGLQDDLIAAVNGCKESLASNLTNQLGRIEEAAQENDIVYPMSSVAKIILLTADAYCGDLLESIPGFLTQAQEMINEAINAARNSTESAGADVQNRVTSINNK